MPKTHYLSNSLINQLRGPAGSAMPRPDKLFVGLFTSAPAPEGGGVEVFGSSYARQEVTLSAPAGGVTSNANDIIFPNSTEEWGLVTSFGLFDAQTGGNLLYFGSLVEPRLVLFGDDTSFDPGQLVFVEL